MVIEDIHWITKLIAYLAFGNASDKRVIFLRVFIAKNDKFSAEQTQIVYSAIIANRYGKCATPNAPHMIFVFYPSELVTNISE